MDGALGTELERRGVAFEGAGWSALALLDHGNIVRDTHADYIRAGADIHIVNSFALALHVLEPLGLGADFERLNRLAVRLFDEATGAAGVNRDSLWAAGSLSTFAANSDRRLLPRGRRLVDNYRRQAELLVDAGVDLLVLEMLFDVDSSRAMLDAVRGCGLPIIVGFTCAQGDGNSDDVTTQRGMGGPVEPFERVLRAVLDSLDIDDAILSVMHSDMQVTDAAIGIVRRYWDGPLAIYPNSGYFVDLHMQFDSVCSPRQFCLSAQRWLDAGAEIIGGCCGIGPAHIAALDTLLESRIEKGGSRRKK